MRERRRVLGQLSLVVRLAPVSDRSAQGPWPPFVSCCRAAANGRCQLWACRGKWPA